LISVKPIFLNQSFSIKIEISKKNYHLRKKDYQLSVINSSVSPLNPLLYIYSLERILYEKKIALKTRLAPGDYFDIWWIGQKLGKNFVIPKPKINKSKFIDEINQLLPDNFKNWAKDFLKKYERR